MKRLPCLLALFCVLAGARLASAQTWELQSPTPTDAELGAVFFLDSLHGWIGGRSETILGTDDGGATWTSRHAAVSPSRRITGLSFANAQDGWAVGYPEVILRTTDGGIVWTPQPADSSFVEGYVFFSSPANGWIAGATLLHTVTGGQTWEEVLLLLPNEFPAACFIDSLHGWLGQENDMFRTVNGGASWQHFEMDTSLHINALLFRDALRGWMIGGLFAGTGQPRTQHLYRTTNGGAAWTLTNGDSLTLLRALAAGANGRVMAVGSSRVVVSADSGQSWAAYPTPAHLPLEAVAASGSRFCAVSSTALIAFSADGDHWEYPGSGASIPLRRICFADELHGWTGGTLPFEATGVIFRTTDGGAHWRPCDHLPRTGEITDLACRDSNHVWAATSDVLRGNILHSSDGGVTWSLQLPDTAPPVNGVSFADSDNGWAAGQLGIHHTTDGGANWTLQHSSDPLVLIRFTDAQHGWAAGTVQVLLRTTDGGNTWNVLPATGLVDVSDMEFSDAHHGWAVNLNGNAYRTTNGGDSWQSMTITDGRLFGRVDFVDSLRSWLSGYSRPLDLPAIWATGNGGATWQRMGEAPMEGGGIDDIFPISPRTGWVVGTRKIFRFEGPASANPHPVTPAVAAAWLAAYPNPFNPRTTLIFQVPAPGRVSLMVYDVLGREVETIADRVLSAGEYHWTFDGSQLSAGVYFVRYTSSTFSQTRRIVLSK